MKKILYLLNVYPRIGPFCMASILAAREMGVEMHLAGNWGYENAEERLADAQKHGVHLHQVDFYRHPLHPKNFRAWQQLLVLGKQENFDLIHCNTPTAGLLGRLLGQRLGIRSVMYQAHGFHFYQDAPFLNWCLYYPMEKRLARLTDTLLVINQEDYALAKDRLRLRGGSAPQYVHGVGVDMHRFAPNPALGEKTRQDLGITPDSQVLLSVGELNANKNHASLVQALADLPGVVCLIAGKGPMHAQLQAQAKALGLADRVRFLGYRRDLPALYQASDVFCLPSFREGLSTAIMEAMASGLPVVASDIRGNRDLVTPQGGRLVPPGKPQALQAALLEVMSDRQQSREMGRHNRNFVQAFSLPQVSLEMQAMYRLALGDCKGETA